MKDNKRNRQGKTQELNGERDYYPASVDMEEGYGNEITTAEPPIYKEVVVIGNGPSGLALSYMLSGRKPYYNGRKHPDEMLNARLSSIDRDESLFESDLEFLAQGLEGRSRNPLSLLFDCLLRPGADGWGCGGESLLDWKSDEEDETDDDGQPTLGGGRRPGRSGFPADHVVIGKGPPGGIWRSMDPNILTLSLSSWMDLPGKSFSEWESHEHQHQQQQEGSSGGSSSEETPPPWETKKAGVCSSQQQFNGSPNPRRVRVERVARYYEDYVQWNGLSRFLKQGVVTSVDYLEEDQGERRKKLWTVRGKDEFGNDFHYLCRHLVLATGSSDNANRLGVEGEESSWIHHDLKSLENSLENISNLKESERGSVLIVGAGLSAADAVLSARFRGLNVVHVYRNSISNSIERMLPESMYPEYHKVYQMMGCQGRGYPGYSCLGGKEVSGFLPGGRVRLRESSRRNIREGKGKEDGEGEGGDSELVVSTAAVLVGARPDLSYLPGWTRDGRGLTVKPSEEVDVRSNPLSVDPFTNRVEIRVEKGGVVDFPPPLYAVGPLAGDNFVRFLIGGAAGVARDICRRLRNYK